MQAPIWLTPYEPTIGVIIEPEFPLVGEPVTVTAWSKHKLGRQNIAPRIVYPANGYEQGLPHGPKTSGEEDDWHWWQWVTDPLPMAASYQVVIRSDTHSTGIGFRAEKPYTPPPEPEPCRGAPREQYERTYVLMPPVHDGNREANKHIILKIMSIIWDLERWTVGGSGDDSGLGDLDVKRVIGVLPGQWPSDLGEFINEHYPGTVYWPLEFDNDYQLRGRLLAYSLKEAGVVLSFPVTGERRITDVFGRWRSEGYNHSGLDLAGSYRKGHQVLAAYPGTVIHAGWMAQGFGETVRILSIAPDGREFDHLYAHLLENSIGVKVGDMVATGDVLAQPDNSGNSFGDHLHFQVNLGRERLDPALLLDWEMPAPEPPAPSEPLIVGLHDESGGRAYPKSLCLAHRIVRHSAGRLDLRDIGPAIVRLNWNYAYQDGTVPPPGEVVSWRNAMVDTILGAQGNVLGFHIGNEINNPSEWPGGYPAPSFTLSPEYYTHEIYNPIWQAVKTLNQSIKLSPAPLDPYNVVAQQFGQPGDPRDWATYIYQHITGADAICLHAKTQTNNPAEIVSFARFSHPPLVGRYLHLRTLTDQLSWIPQRFADKPVYVTELNPQFRVQDKEVGWYAENTRWIHDSHTFISTYPQIRGIVYYRYDVAGDQSNYGLRQFPALLDAIENYIEVE